MNNIFLLHESNLPRNFQEYVDNETCSIVVKHISFIPSISMITSLKKNLIGVFFFVSFCTFIFRVDMSLWTLFFRSFRCLYSKEIMRIFTWEERKRRKKSITPILYTLSFNCLVSLSDFIFNYRFILVLKVT